MRKPNDPPEEPLPDEDPAQEPHLKPKEIAKQWGISESKATQLFQNEPGVLKLGNRSSRRRTRISLRIPLSVAQRVHKERSA